jgi:hypothetical protein
MPEYSDSELADFLKSIDKAVGIVDVTNWEASFIDSNLDRTSFSEKQREIIKRMINQYAEQIKW